MLRRSLVPWSLRPLVEGIRAMRGSTSSITWTRAIHRGAHILGRIRSVAALELLVLARRWWEVGSWGTVLVVHIWTSRRVDGWWGTAWHGMVCPMATLIEFVGGLILRESTTAGFSEGAKKGNIGTYDLGSAGRGSVQK